MKVTIIPIVIGAFCTVTKGLLKGLEDLEVGDHPNNRTIEDGDNTEKSPWYLRRLAVTHSPVKDHQLTLMWKTLMNNNNNNNNKKKKKKKKKKWTEKEKKCVGVKGSLLSLVNCKWEKVSTYLFPCLFVWLVG